MLTLLRHFRFTFAGHDVTPIVWNLVKHKFTSDHDLRYLQAKNRYDLSKPETSIWVSPLSSHQKIVPVMNFAAILPYAYVPAIHSHVVELPLDVRYLNKILESKYLIIRYIKFKKKEYKLTWCKKYPMFSGAVRNVSWEFHK